MLERYRYAFDHTHDSFFENFCLTRRELYEIVRPYISKTTGPDEERDVIIGFLRGGAVVVCCAAVCGALAACGSSSSSSGTESASTTKASGATGTVATSKISQATIDEALQYTGGKAGKADPSLPPVTIGFVMQKSGTVSFPGTQAAAEASVRFVNDYLGGAAGHPLKLDECFMAAEEDGQRCGAKLVADKVPIGLQEVAVVGNASLYRTVGQKFPILDSPATGPDNTAPDVYSLSGGGSAVIYGMAADAKQIGVSSVALLSVGNPGGMFTMQTIAEPALSRLGVKHGKTVYYGQTPTTPDIVSALQAAGGSSAGAIFFDPASVQQCLSLRDALKELGRSIPVISSPVCIDPILLNAAGGPPPGWRFWTYGASPYLTSDPEVRVYRNVMAAYGQSQYTDDGLAPPSMRDVLTVTKFANAIGYNKLSAVTLRQQLLAFPGPAFLMPGPMHCGKPIDRSTPALCGQQAQGSVYDSGTWKLLGPVTFVPAS